MQKILLIAGLIALATGGLLSMFPLWRSAILSPDSIQRRTYWAGTVAAAVLLFLAQLPNWPAGLFAGGMLALAMIATAGVYTNFIKIGGRVYSAAALHRGPDRPPALADED